MLLEVTIWTFVILLLQEAKLKSKYCRFVHCKSIVCSICFIIYNLFFYKQHLLFSVWNVSYLLSDYLCFDDCLIDEGQIRLTYIHVPYFCSCLFGHCSQFHGNHLHWWLGLCLLLYPHYGWYPANPSPGSGSQCYTSGSLDHAFWPSDTQSASVN